LTDLREDAAAFSHHLPPNLLFDQSLLMNNSTMAPTKDALEKFAAQQTKHIDEISAMNDKEIQSKLNELKEFADNFKLPTPVPLDLLSIMANDPEKQKQIQEKTNHIEKARIYVVLDTSATQQGRVIQQMRARKATQNREKKINGLKKFAAGFKLKTPVPADLLSIIANDPVKQKELLERAKRNVEEAEANRLKTATVVWQIL
jgi:hypothetical protein